MGRCLDGLTARRFSKQSFNWGRRRVLSASYARLGDLDSARTQREIVMAETPGYTAADSRLHQPYENPAHIQPFIDGLVLAGFPAGDPS